MNDDRSWIAVGMTWAWRVISVSLQMVVPGVLGIWLDRMLGTVALFTVLGFAGGLVLGVWSLMRLSESTGAPNNKMPRKNGNTP